MSSTIMPGKSDRELYKYANYIFDKHFNANNADFNKDDMVQAAILYVWQRKDQFDPEKGSLNGWLWTMLVYGMKSERKTIRSRDIHPVRDNVGDGMDRYYNTATEMPKLDVTTKERADAFAKRVLAGEFGLPKKQMSVMVKILDKDMTQGEIAIEENATPQSISARWMKAVEKIEQRLNTPVDPPKPIVHPKRFLFRSPEGKRVSTTCIRVLAAKNGINGKCSGERISHAGWTRLQPIRKRKKVS